MEITYGEFESPKLPTGKYGIAYGEIPVGEFEKGETMTEDDFSASYEEITNGKYKCT